MSNKNMNLRILAMFSYLLGIASFSMFIFTTFFSNIAELEVQGIYWFMIATLCIFLPSIFPLVSKVKFQDLEIELRDRLEDVEKRITEVEDAFIKSFENLKRQEQGLPPSFIAMRNKHWDSFDARMQSLDKEDRFNTQSLNSLRYLQEYNITVQELKKRLAKLGFYKGEMDNIFSQELADAIEHFQRFNNMRHIDGMFGPLTFEKIAERLADISKREDNEQAPPGL